MPLIALAWIAAQAAAAGSNDRALLQNCDAHKFETIVETSVDGQIKHSRVRLCGMEGQSDAEWVRTLKDAVAKTEANLKMPKAQRDQIVTALNAEIARLNSPALSGGIKGLTPRSTGPSNGLQGYSSLPPMPAPRQAAPAQPLRDYAALPPLPTAPTAPVHVLPGAPGSPIPLLPGVKLSFSCMNPNDLAGEGPCTGFERETLLTVRAGENLPAGTSLRFVRDGSARADVQLAQLQRGKSMSFPLPTDVCTHATGGKLEIKIVRANKATGPDGQEVGTDGPYNLRC